MKEVFENAPRVDLFQHIMISDTNRSIRSVFQLGAPINYKPPYQREYVWNDAKATYLIETILLHGEVTPIVVYKKGDSLEVIDGRQRCQTIDRFLKGDFTLRPHGLDRLWNIAGKSFQQLDDKLKERIQDTVLRLVVIEAKDEVNMDERSEEVIKREIFRRYNMGISPLRKEEVFKAQYLQDDINMYFKESFEKDKDFYRTVGGIFDHRNKNLETMMQHIRQLLVLHNIPINKYLYEREDIINKYYDYLSYSASQQEVKENVKQIYNDFKRKVLFIQDVKTILSKKGSLSDGLIFECLYWALSVCEAEELAFERIDNAAFKKKLLAYIIENVQDYRMDKNVYYQQIRQVYQLLATFFAGQLDVQFTHYLKSNEEFIVKHKVRMENYLRERFKPGEEQDNFSKMKPTSNTVTDILDKMSRGKFNLRPPYQRDEVMDVKKASSLIESILLGVRLNPIFVYLREDGVAEVIDGQQRLLAIIGFLGEKYQNESGKEEISKKDKFSLNLQSGLLSQLHGKKYSELSDMFKNRIKDCDISIIEIKQQDNKHFKPEELFKRINHKPCPIKVNSFEFWNAYIDNEIISEIKGIQKRHDWLSIRKDDKRMLNQELTTSLCYLHFTANSASLRMASVREVLSANTHLAGIVVKVKDKAHITAMLENKLLKSDFLLALNSFELDFVEKVKFLISSSSGKTTGTSVNRRLDALLQTTGARAAMNFFVLWWVLSGVSIEYIMEQRSVVESRINMIFKKLKKSDSVESMEKLISDTWALSRAAETVV